MAGSILIVDDEDDIARLLAVNLEAEGYECHLAGKGDDALDLALKLRPDLILLDLMLPGIDGVEVCRLLRKDPRTAFVAIIMLTARSLPADRIAGLEAGADDYVDKPFHIDEILARVHRSLLRGRQLRATSPLTGLPGNFVIEAVLDRRIADGDEFALLLPATTVAEAGAIAERLQQASAATWSYGVSLLDDDLDEALHRADRAMYAQKAAHEAPPSSVV